MRRILVTGAGGFIGHRIASLLARDAAMDVRAATRDGRAIGPGLTPTRLDVLATEQLAAALTGVDAIVHCAVGDRPTTVEGTHNLLVAARTAGVRRVVHLSSISIYGGATGRVDESTPSVPATGKGYAASKAAAEQACRMASQAGADVIMLRPAIVYGAGSRLWIDRPVAQLRARQIGDMGAAGEGLCNLVHVDDVAAAARAAILAVGGGGEAFNVAGGSAMTWNTWHTRLAEAIGMSVPRLSPGQMRRQAMLALPIKALAKLVPGLRARLAAPLLAISRSELTLFALKAEYPIDKARAALGWSPSVPLDDGLRDAVRSA